MAHSPVDQVRRMARYNAWANGRLLDACRRLPDEAFVAERVSFFSSLRETLHHILLVDRCYLADLVGTGRATVADTPSFARAADLAAAQREMDRRLVAFCDGLTEEYLDRVVAIERNDGVDYRETVEAILAHLFVHQIHHRGQVHAMLAGTTVAPPQLDEFFLASEAAGADAELEWLGLGDHAAD